jgi:hypothetical protein
LVSLGPGSEKAFMVQQENRSFHEALRREVYAALKDAGIYEIGSYGWLNENDPDPDYIGHAMWQIEAPPLDQSALFGEGPVNRRPEDIEREILTSGEDFWGLMEASRLSIGLTLIWKPQARDNPISEDDFFWLHHTDSFLKLAIASDRLRDLLVIACTGSPPKRYKKGYTTPFDHARALIAKRGIPDQHLDGPLGALPALARELAKFRVRRNAIVHDVTTRMADFVGNTVTNLQKRFDQQRAIDPESELQSGCDWLKRGGERRAEIELEIDVATEELKEWYTLLIQTSNYVFQVEYWTRRYEAYTIDSLTVEYKLRSTDS